MIKLFRYIFYTLYKSLNKLYIIKTSYKKRIKINFTYEYEQKVEGRLYNILISKMLLYLILFL